MKRVIHLALAAGLAAASVDFAEAATATANVSVSMVIAASCNITTPSALNFGSAGVLSTNIDAYSVFNVTCSANTPYSIALDAGTGGGTTSTRKMKNGASGSAATIDYNLYRDASRTMNWGTGGEALTGTGTGVAVPTYIYGRVPPQTASATGAYSDTVALTITY